MTAAVVVIIIILALAWANGANDVAKGVATLAGSGTSSAVRAIMWGTVCTLIGGLAAAVWGAALITTFSSGFLAAGFPVTLGFIGGVVVGAAAWILLATRFGLPVSTTHALLGGIVGTVLLLAGPEGLRATAVANKALLPLLLGPLLAIVLCWMLLLAARFVEKKIPAWRPGCCEQKDWQRNPFVCAEDRQVMPAPIAQRVLTVLHWLSSGAASFARGLNDVPKIAAFLILVLALAPALPLSARGLLWPIVAVALVMALGGLWGGMRVLRVMAHRVSSLDSTRGLMANVSTSLLVLAATPLGLPVSTTHVSTGALMGVRWSERVKPQQNDALRLILFGWLITLPVAGGFAATSAWLFRTMG
ncbi:MAG: inorganic phosphate transporter [Proteobacteria bacterium]|nr:inorganic phosphate transporter [Pseudomonadota bacterium]